MLLGCAAATAAEPVRPDGLGANPRPKGQGLGPAAATVEAAAEAARIAGIPHVSHTGLDLKFCAPLPRSLLGGLLPRAWGAEIDPDPRDGPRKKPPSRGTMSICSCGESGYRRSPTFGFSGHMDVTRIALTYRRKLGPELTITHRCAFLIAQQIPTSPIHCSNLWRTT